MAEEMVPVPNTATLNGVVEGEGCSESNSSNSPQGRNNRLKGVVLQPNGHWGAQIYSNTRESSRVRIWIGTFESESEAAKAYDTVAVKLGSRDSHRNYPLTALTSLEPDFQKLLTLDAVVKMLRDGSYETKLYEFAVNSCSLKQDKEPDFSQSSFTGSAGDGAVTYQELFRKELTPSDVGKLNRLVIPKKYAMDYFPALPAGGIDEVQLPVYDREMNCWIFRYCFWRSSHSFVFTEGWNRFVKGKKLKAGDVVTFYTMSEHCEGHKAFYMIDVASKSGGGGCGIPAGDLQSGFSQLTINESRPMSKL